MSTCFVIQPFDNGKFDKRFEQIYKPAIKEAGLDPYRVDQDPRVDVPIESIEAGIRSSSVCVAEITTDNPNVWYELGFAFAVGVPVVMLCSSEREGKRFPFDIQHRAIITYKVDAPEDFNDLREKITERIKALVERGDTLRQIADAEPLAPVAGLSSNEVTALAVLAGNVDSPAGSVSLYSARTDAEVAGMTKLGFNLAVRRLSLRSFVETFEDSDYDGNPFDALKITNNGWAWIDANETLFSLRRKLEDEIPF